MKIDLSIADFLPGARYSPISNSPKQTIQRLLDKYLSLGENRCDAFENGGKTFIEVTFPDGYDLPAFLPECGVFSPVAFLISGKFRFPKFGVVCWDPVIAFLAVMPETAMNEYRDLSTYEGYIGTAWNTLVV